MALRCKSHRLQLLVAALQQRVFGDHFGRLLAGALPAPRFSVSLTADDVVGLECPESLCACETDVDARRTE